MAKIILFIICMGLIGCASNNATVVLGKNNSHIYTQKKGSKLDRENYVWWKNHLCQARGGAARVKFDPKYVNEAQIPSGNVPYSVIICSTDLMTREKTAHINFKLD